MKSTIVDTIYLTLRDEIVTGKIDSNELILEQSVATKYNISKVTAREILKKLCHEKYLKSYPRKGYFINEISSTQCFQIQQLRYQIESLSLRLVMKNSTQDDLNNIKLILNQHNSNTDPYNTINTKFHMQLANLSQNEYLYDTLYTYMGSISRYAIKGAVFYKNFATTDYHLDILEALQSKDEKKALHFLRLDLQLNESDI